MICRSLMLFLALTLAAHADARGSGEQDSSYATSTGPSGADGSTAGPGRYTFGWPLGDDPRQAPRGGSSRGAPVTPDPDRSIWAGLAAPATTAKERDRRAILALAGEFRVTFDFLETVTYLPGAERARPYQSWATEYVSVIDEQADFISLQHVMVMRFIDEDGSIRGPFVQKHWRQDWHYQAHQTLAFEGDGRWQVLPSEDAEGTWTQTVHQVDDTPRYSATGRWTHRGDYSAWEAERAWRPLPRREQSVRDDYDVMASRHRVSITPDGWVHEQDNLKAVLDDSGRLDADTPYLAREQGLARYQRIVDQDFSAGYAYWEETEGYWALVREWWQSLLARKESFRLLPSVDGQPLFMPLFEGAARAADDPDFDAQAMNDFVSDTLDRYIEAP